MRTGDGAIDVGVVRDRRTEADLRRRGGWRIGQHHFDGAVFGRRRQGDRGCLEVGRRAFLLDYASDLDPAARIDALAGIEVEVLAARPDAGDPQRALG